MTDLLKPQLNADGDVWSRIDALRIRDESVLAPNFRAALDAAVDECHRSSITVTVDAEPVVLPLDVRVFETLRTDELQRIYYAQHVTNAATARYSWHFYGLAADLISARYEWFDGVKAKAAWPDANARAAVAAKWFRAVGEIAIKHGLEWGGNWHKPDMPHVQWGKCHDSPTEAPAVYDRAGGGDAGRRAVWLATGAI